MASSTDSSLTPAVDWVDGRLVIIDQTALPTSLELLALTTTDQVVDAIYRLAVRGAPAIGVCGAYGMVVGFDEARPTDLDAARSAIDALTHRIGTARPTAVNLAWAVDRVRTATLGATTVESIRATALAEAQAIQAEDIASCDAIGRHGADELVDRHRILTHCNTGRLATAGRGTALGVVYTKAERGHPVEVYACETRPLLQGARLTAWELVDAGLPATLLSDGAGAALLGTGGIDAVITGADRIAANGDSANKIGTRAHAIAAHYEGVPFYIAAPLSTFDPALPSGTDIEIEFRADDEVRRFRSEQSAPSGIATWNAAFDVTPAELITGIITEVGVLRSPFVDSIAAAFAAKG
ncbi:MAG: S-methyl-5-thioribose-1-phosphate isomerase [Acidimicrobiales bacterium]